MADCCNECGSTYLNVREAAFEFEHDGHQLSILDEQTWCESCGNITYVGDQIPRHLLNIAAKIREFEGLLSTEDLLRIRTKYGLSQTEMEALLSIGPKTWTRWERGKISHTKATDQVIRRIDTDPPYVAELMMARNMVNDYATAVIARAESQAVEAAAKVMVDWRAYQDIAATALMRVVIRTFQNTLAGRAMAITESHARVAVLSAEVIHRHFGKPEPVSSTLGYIDANGSQGGIDNFTVQPSKRWRSHPIPPSLSVTIPVGQ